MGQSASYNFKIDVKDATNYTLVRRIKRWENALEWVHNGASRDIFIAIDLVKIVGTFWNSTAFGIASLQGSETTRKEWQKPPYVQAGEMLISHSLNGR